MSSDEDTVLIEQTSSSSSMSSSTGDNHAGVGLSDPQFSHGRRKMLDLVNRLHSTGVQVDIDLPQIAVIGAQSAGKSSLIESISGITLPRASGTCTRCPTECRLSSSDGPWKCIVSIRLIVDINGQPLGQAINKQFGDTIYEKEVVEDRIRRAQRAILNPSKPIRSFLEENDEVEDTDTQVSFSSNCVTLQISGPDVADLSFCDLPGLIASQSGSRGGDSDIDLVQNLVTSYIKKPSCIILLTVACETDFENQGAHRLAKEHDPDGKRTIGVLTKPDRIPLGEEANWLKFIRNEREPLVNNWFCVKQPSSDDLKKGITWSRARDVENRFFFSTAPWSELEGIYQSYLRTSNLVKRLSTVLSDLIAKRLPQIQEELEKSIQIAYNSLSSLPKEPSSDPRSEISSLLHVFTADLAKHVEGVPDSAQSTFGEGQSAGLIQRIRPAQETFRRAIQATTPNFRPYEKKDGGTRTFQSPSFLKSEEEEAKRDCLKPTSVIYLDEVLQKATQARTRELPGHYPFAVQKAFIEEIVKKWRSPAMVMCKAVHAVVSERVKELVLKHFSEFGQGQLASRINFILHQHLKSCLEKAQESVNWLLRLEDAPFSLNTHYLADYREKFYAFYKGARTEAEGHALMSTIKSYQANPSAQTSMVYSKSYPNGTLQQTGVAKVLSALDEIGLHGLKPDDLAKLLPSDPMEHAISIMADVRAYFQVAYKRVADNIPLAIDYELVRGVERHVLQVLYSQLGINGVDGQRICSEMSYESPQLAAKRAELKKKLERLEKASGELLSLGA
ncbi:P-loop containing nucleoside triphosphate hydrolase protein [Crepidotus variabilis]|uniref:P-loop containing nucleoside triphosphate hydrolase protein n=1 Tax=Crepidotus variabilis TaxID=179855 RepID=A0A9P6JLA0_9AGAR|nr:P-loop containing nucleoside triphosphate hydrolase protein [Crepidotus variabilis]